MSSDPVKSSQSDSDSHSLALSSAPSVERVDGVRATGNRRYEVEIRVTGSGHVEVEAPDEKTARDLVDTISPEIDLGLFVHESMAPFHCHRIYSFDVFADLDIEGVCEIGDAGSANATSRRTETTRKSANT